MDFKGFHAPNENSETRITPVAIGAVIVLGIVLLLVSITLAGNRSSNPEPQLSTPIEAPQIFDPQPYPVLPVVIGMELKSFQKTCGYAINGVDDFNTYETATRHVVRVRMSTIKFRRQDCVGLFLFVDGELESIFR